MNRRAFMQLAGIFLASAIFGKADNEDMELGNIWVKMANNQRLTSQELDFLRNAGRDTQLRNSFIAGNTTEQNTLKLDLPIDVIWSSGIMNKNFNYANAPVITIPQTYNHIFITTNARSSETTPGGAYWDHAAIFNGDTGTNYGYQVIRSVSTALDATSVSGDTWVTFGLIVGDDSAANFSSSVFTVIPNYRSPFYKQCISIGGDRTLSRFYSSTWNGTDAIRTIQFYTTFKSGSSVSIFGVR